MIPLSPLLQSIQTGILLSSAALFSGALYEIRSRAKAVRLDLLTQAYEAGEHLIGNKRRHLRSPCDLLIEIMDRDDRVAALGRVLNLSSAGACITSTADFRRGAPFLARLPMLRKNSNRISGQVVWARLTAGKFMYGIRLHAKIPA